MEVRCLPRRLTVVGWILWILNTFKSKEKYVVEDQNKNLQAHEVRKGSNVINPNPVQTVKIQPQPPQQSGSPENMEKE